LSQVEIYTLVCRVFSFYRAACIACIVAASWSSHDKAVRLSVRPSVCQMRELWQNRRQCCPHFYTI